MSGTSGARSRGLGFLYYNVVWRGSLAIGTGDTSNSIFSANLSSTTREKGRHSCVACALARLRSSLAEKTLQPKVQ